MKQNKTLICGRHCLDLSRVQVMGILNTTPDSFSDGGRHYGSRGFSLDSALFHADAMLQAGATIIDVGGESTRPGAEVVSDALEVERVVPLIEALVARFDALVSVDTSSPAVMQASAAAGAGLINDVRALSREGALETASASGLAVCLMHMQGAPLTMQNAPRYGDVVTEVSAYLSERVDLSVSAGIAKEKILIDPGFGFGKTLGHNFELLARLPEFADLGLPILIGLSRKSMFGQLLGREVSERLPGSLAGALLAAQRGAHILRVHDVAETSDVLRVLQMVNQFKESENNES